jgi:NAD(P)-dependent dehydrogenase (short-subunit alcohol dehydrogenase family)
MTNRSGVSGRAIIVTGGGGGIGRGIVRHLASQGADVVVGEIDQAALASTIDELAATGASCLGVQTDVTRRESIEVAVDETLSRFGRVDGLLNNASVRIPLAPIMEITDEILDATYTSQVKATLWGMQAVYPHMKAQGWGRIVNVGSSSGLVGFKGNGAYASAKEAIRSLTRTAAREWMRDGIVVNCYLPISMGHHYAQSDAEFVDPDGYIAETVRVTESLLPAGDARTVGDPESDLGPAVAFLLSDDCRYLTGQTLTLDGGTYAFA